MRNFSVMLIMLLTLQAHSRNIDNWEHDGFPVIIPKVKKCTHINEEFPLPKSLSVTAPQEMSLRGLEKTFSERTGGKIERAGKGAVRFQLTGKGVPENEEGYTLEVNRNGVTVSARTISGLHYGMQSLRWIIRNTRGNALKGCKIEDFPDLKFRGVFWGIDIVMRNDADALCKAIDIFAQLKYNTLFIDFGSNFPLKDNPYTLRKFTYSIDDIRRIQKACADNSIEIIPSVEAVTHVAWMRHHPEFETKISEGKPTTPWRASYCLSKPLPIKLMKDYIADLIAVLKPRYFCLTLDEIDICPFQVCEQCKKQDPVELFGNHAKMLVDYVLELGVIPMVPYDQFAPDVPFFHSKVRAALTKLDRRTVIRVWDHNLYPNPYTYEYFKNLGFKQFDYISWSEVLDNPGNLSRVAAKAGAMGQCVTWWWDISPALTWRDKSTVNGYASVVSSASDSWNISDQALVKRDYDPVFEMKRLVDSDKVLNYENRQGTPIPLNLKANAALGQNRFFPLLDAVGIAKLKSELSARKENFHLIADNGKYFGVVLTGGMQDSFPAGSVDIPVGRTADGLSFLMSAAAFNDFLPLKRRMKPEIGMLKINYKNSKSLSLPLIYRNNLNAWNAEVGTYNARIINRGFDRRGAAYSFYAVDWKNPFPADEIKSITFSTKKQDGIAMGLFAISAFGVGAGGEKVMSDAEIAQHISAVTPKKDYQLYSLTNFELEGNRNIITVGTTKRRFVSRPKFNIVNAPLNAPAKGKMLSIYVPPLAKGCVWGRICVDIPIEKEDFKTVLFDLRFSNPQSIWRADTYIKKGKKANGLRKFIIVPVDNNFYSYAIPRLAYLDKERCSEVPGQQLRIGFFVHNKEPMTIDIARIAVSQDDIPWIREIRADSK